MAGRIARVRRSAFAVALLVSAALYAYSLAGIVRAGDDLPAGPVTVPVEHSVPVWDEHCPDERDDVVRL